jgi:5-methylcytosine-specific restriction enzyme A
MPTMPPMFRPHGGLSGFSNREYDRERGSAAARLYGRRWRKASQYHLSRFPLCRYCELRGEVAAATLVDHLYPHKGNIVLFWQTIWWVSSCEACHNSFKQQIEREGMASIDALARRLGLPTLAEMTGAATG